MEYTLKNNTEVQSELIFKSVISLTVAELI